MFSFAFNTTVVCYLTEILSLSACCSCSVPTGKREDYLEWPEYFMAVAFLSAQRSKDPSSQVCVCICLTDKAHYAFKCLFIVTEILRSIQFTLMIWLFPLPRRLEHVSWTKRTKSWGLVIMGCRMVAMTTCCLGAVLPKTSSTQSILTVRKHPLICFEYSRNVDYDLVHNFCLPSRVTFNLDMWKVSEVYCDSTFSH